MAGPPLEGVPPRNLLPLRARSPHVSLPVFDFHLHVEPWFMLRSAVQPVMAHGRSVEEVSLLLRLQKEGAPAILRYLDEEGITRANVIAYAAPDVMGFTRDIHGWTAKLLAGAEDRLHLWASVHPQLVEDPLREVDHLVHELRARGLKFHPLHQGFAPNAHLEDSAFGRRLAATYRRCEELDVPVMFHTGTSIFPGARNKYGDPMLVDDVAVDFPNLRIVLAHAGRPLWCPGAMFLARAHRNVHLDLSGIPPRKLLEYLPDLPRLADKCFWGSDWPGPGVPSPGANARAFEALPLPEDAKRKMLWENAARFMDRA